MVVKINSITIIGLEIRPIVVEVDVSPGLFDFTIVGMPSKVILESKKRIYAAIQNSGFRMPSSHITVNLAPADIPKASTGFDLPIAVGILAATSQINIKLTDKVFWGELSLNGEMQYTNGVLAIAMDELQKQGKYLIIPRINAKEALIVGMQEIIPIGHLRDIPALLAVKNIYSKKSSYKRNIQIKRIPDLQIINNKRLIRAIMLSVLGRLNIILIGPAGAGKTFILKVIENIINPLPDRYFYEVNKIYSIAGLIKDHFIDYPPFRYIHHTITQAAFIGGGSKFRIGEICLAHGGFLFMDEFNLFDKNIIELLRQPLQDKFINIQRGQYSFNIPCDFTLLASMNPCKCGNYGSIDKQCACSNYEIQKYWRRLSRPILDRIDMQIFVQQEQSKGAKLISLLEIKRQIDAAQEFSSNNPDKKVNKQARKLLESSSINLGLSLRGANKLLNIAKAISDLDQCDEVKEDQVAEAITFRTNINI